LRKSIRVKREIEKEQGILPEQEVKAAPEQKVVSAPANKAVKKQPVVEYERDFFGNIIGVKKSVNSMSADEAKNAQMMPKTDRNRKAKQ